MKADNIAPCEKITNIKPAVFQIDATSSNAGADGSMLTDKCEMRFGGAGKGVHFR